MPSPAPRPIPPLAPAEEADVLDAPGEVGAPKPLHRSPKPLCSDTDDWPPADALASFGATELASTDCPPRLSVPAVAPLRRAAKSVDGAAPLPGRATELPLPAPERPEAGPEPAPERPEPPRVRFESVEPRDPRDPLVEPRDPLVEPLLPLAEPLDPEDEPLDPEEPPLPPLEPEEDPLDPDEEPLEGAGAFAPGPVPGSPPPGEGELPPPPPGVGIAGDGADGVAGVPVPGPVQAHAMLCHMRAPPRTASTAKVMCRARLDTCIPHPLSE